MTDITLYNTRTRAKDRLDPLDPANVRMYVCGPTVYDRAHIGNARPTVVFDVLYRLLCHVYGPDHVTYVRNITDVDDKIITRARESDRPIDAITEETIGWYHEDMAALGVLPPTHEPRATGYIGPMIAMIETLIARGHAYEAQGHVLFSVTSYSDYGKLARRSLDEMRAGSRVEVAPYKRDPMDFVLWKPSDATQPGWDSPWGRGRPGWHIECSAMAYELLGPSFDIHGGGIDLAFPHHENEVAQSRCAHPEGTFANIWMHNGFLNVEGEKMSKSLGNFFTVRDLLDRGIPGEVIRFVLLSTHYRQPIDWTERKVEEVQGVLNRWSEKLVPYQYLFEEPPADDVISADLLAALANDLNTPQAIAVLHSLVGSISERDQRSSEEHERHESSARALISGCSALGIPLADYARRYFKSERFMSAEARIELSRAYNKANAGELIEALIARRDRARRARNFAMADQIRQTFAEAGVILTDAKSGTEWDLAEDFDLSKLEALQ